MPQGNEFNLVTTLADEGGASPNFDLMSLETVSKSTQWYHSCLEYHHRETRERNDKEPSQNSSVGIPGLAPGGKFYETNAWWTEVKELFDDELLTEEEFTKHKDLLMIDFRAAQ